MTNPTTTRLHNPYWELIADLVTTSWDGRPEVDGYPWPIENNQLRREQLTSTYAWTITAPATVAFVTAHTGPSAIDPLAGTGYWAYLLQQQGIDVAVTDIAPPDSTNNPYHDAGITHTRVLHKDAVAAVKARCSARSLLLSWPPYDSPLGFDIIRAYQGNRIVYIGEGEYGCCGDDAMFDLLNAEWVQVADHRPVQFRGLRDWVTVYDRRPAVTS